MVSTTSTGAPQKIRTSKHNDCHPKAALDAKTWVGIGALMVSIWVAGIGVLSHYFAPYDLIAVVHEAGALQSEQHKTIEKKFDDMASGQRDMRAHLDAIARAVDRIAEHQHIVTNATLADIPSAHR